MKRPAHDKRIVRSHEKRALIAAELDRHSTGIHSGNLAEAVEMSFDAIKHHLDALRKAGKAGNHGWGRWAVWFTARNAETAIAQYRREHLPRNTPARIRSEIWECQDMEVRQVCVPAHTAKPLRKLGPASVWEMAA